MTVGKLSKRIGTWPAIRSFIAGAAPRYGTCLSLAPVIFLNNSADRWCVDPIPDEAQLTSSDLCFAISKSSLTVEAGNFGLTIKTIGTVASRATGVKSTAGSNGSFL